MNNKYLNSHRFIILNVIMWSFFILSTNRSFAETQNKMRRGVFILNIEIGKDIPTAHRDLLARVHQEIPNDILEQRGLKFEDITLYSDIKGWNPSDFFAQRSQKHIENYLRLKQMKEMLTLSISYTPDEKKRKLLLSGRRYDLDELTGILARATGPSAETPANDVSTTFREATVELETYDSIQSALRTLFSRLFQIPEIEILNHPTEPIEPGNTFITHFSVKTNNILANVKHWKSRNSSIASDELDDLIADGAEIKNQSEGGGFSSSVTVIETERTLPEDVCRKPSRYIDNGLDLGRDRKRNDAERWILADGTKVLGESTPQFSHYMELFPNQNRGFGLIEKRSKILDTDYIVRIQLKAIEKGISAVSYPVYQCIKSREHRTILGLSFRPGYRVGALSGIDSDGYMGIDLFMGYTFRLTGLFFLPGFTIGGVLGYSWTGTSTDQFALLNYNVIEFRPHLDIELVRLPIRNGVSCSIGAIVDIGIGANLYSYHGHIDRSDWGAVSMIGGGGRLSIRGPSVLQIGVSAIVQNRMQRITIDGALPSDPIIATDVKIVWLVWELMFRIKR